MTRLRPSPRYLSMLAALVLSACTGPAAEDDDGTDDQGTDDGTDEPQACIDPGTELLAEAKPAAVPLPGSSNFTCSSGWATDAPQRDPAWTVGLGQAADEFLFTPLMLGAHPDGGVIVAGNGVFRRYDASGEAQWSSDAAVAVSGQVALAVEDAGTIVVSTYDWNTDDVALTRYDADGGTLGTIDIAWNSPYPSIWAIARYGTDIIVAASDEDAMGNWDQALIRIDADGNEILRKSTNMSGGQLLAVNDSGTAMFGTVPGFLVSLDNGAVLGTLTPSSGFPAAVRGFGDDFYAVGNAAGDYSVARYSSLGTERWLQTYDRATLGDQGRALDVGPDGDLVTVGSTSLLDFNDVYWYGTQPIVLAVDGDGNALWSDRMSAHGDATGVAIGTSGEVYVAGIAEGDMPPGQEPPQLLWLRGY